MFESTCFAGCVNLGVLFISLSFLYKPRWTVVMALQEGYEDGTRVCVWSLGAVPGTEGSVNISYGSISSHSNQLNTAVID